MTYAEAIQFLYELRWFGAKFGLENTRKLAALCGHPQNRLRFIHVAGTNGKGSTCAMLESIYRSAGLRVGLFTSPHLVSFRERLQVNRKAISESDVVQLVEKMRPLFEQFPADHHPTFFEVVTVIAMLYFAEQQCDLVIWETGLGGRLDATNVVTPMACVVTNVQLDHQQWLGNTLAEIAAEKAGIIKPGIPVITATDEADVLAVITERANRLNAPLKILTTSDLRTDISLPLLGEHQHLNAALAITTVSTLQNDLPVSETQIREGLSRLDWPGRLQLVKFASGQTLLLDGAHNVAGAQALRLALENYFSGRKLSLILGVLADKDWQHICETLAPLAARILTVPVSSERSADASQLAAACSSIQPSAIAIACTSLKDALEQSEADQFVVVTGSLYLVGETLDRLGISSVTGSERELNEWQAVPAGASASP